MPAGGCHATPSKSQSFSPPPQIVPIVGGCHATPSNSQGCSWLTSLAAESSSFGPQMDPIVGGCHATPSKLQSFSPPPQIEPAITVPYSFAAIPGSWIPGSWIPGSWVDTGLVDTGLVAVKSRWDPALGIHPNRCGRARRKRRRRSWTRALR